MHQVGDRVQSLGRGWFGRVLAIECARCGSSMVNGKCTTGHSTGSEVYFLTVAQDNVPGDMRPWCLPERFPIVRRTTWEHVLENLLVLDGE